MNIHDATETAYKNGYARGFEDGKAVCKHNGITIKPDGIHPLSQHLFVEEECLKNVTVQILRCRKCGHVSIGWYRQANTEEVGADNG